MKKKKDPELSVAGTTVSNSSVNVASSRPIDINEIEPHPLLQNEIPSLKNNDDVETNNSGTPNLGGETKSVISVTVKKDSEGEK